MALNGNVIVVTIGYRIGVFGFLTSGTSQAPGNYGLWDIRMALTWIKENIKYFGGDSKRVTLMGQSVGGGGAIVTQIMLSKTFDGLYHRVISQSGTAFSVGPWEVNGYAKAKQLCDALLCPPRSVTSMLSCLREKSTQEILSHIMVPVNAKIHWGVTIDGELFTHSPDELLINRTVALKNVSFLGGSIPTEGLKEGRYISYISSGKDSFLSIMKLEFFDTYFLRADSAYTATRLEYFYPDENMRRVKFISILIQFFVWEDCVRSKSRSPMQYVVKTLFKIIPCHVKLVRNNTKFNINSLSPSVNYNNPYWFSIGISCIWCFYDIRNVLYICDELV